MDGDAEKTRSQATYVFSTNAKGLEVQKLRCVFIDSYIINLRFRLQWIPFHMPDDAVRKLLETYGKIGDVGRKRWRVGGLKGVKSTAGGAGVALKTGLTRNDVSARAAPSGGERLDHHPGAATGPPSMHVRRHCRVPKFSVCSHFGHEKETCMNTYAGVTGGAVVDELSQHIMDLEEAEKRRLVPA